MTSVGVPKTLLVGGFNPSEKYESQWAYYSQYIEKMKNVPNHQPEVVWYPKLWTLTDLFLHINLFLYISEFGQMPS